MSLAGNLEDLPIPDIFQIIHLSAKSGILSVRRTSQQRGITVISNGKVVGAWTPKSVEILSDILSSERLTLPGAIERLDPKDPQSLGQVKESMSPPFFTEERSFHILDQFTRASLLDLMQWRSGTFEFQLKGNHPSEDPIPPDWILLPEGFSADPMSLESARLSDETQRDESTGKFKKAKFEPTSVYTEPLFNLAEELRDQFEEKEQRLYQPLSPGLDLLKSMLFELHLPDVHTYITLLILRYASSLMNRAVLLEVRGERFVGLGEFGLHADKDEAAKLIRRVNVPRNEPSVLAIATKDLLPMKLPPDLDREWDRKLIEMLGATIPSEIFIGPIVSNGELVALLYGDNLPEQKPIGDTETLEIFLSQAGLSIERALRKNSPTTSSATS